MHFQWREICRLPRAGYAEPRDDVDEAASAASAMRAPARASSRARRAAASPSRRARSASRSSADSSSATSGTIAPGGAGRRGLARKARDAELIDGVEIGEEQQRRAARAHSGDTSASTSMQPRSAGKRARAGGSDRRSVRERIAVGNAELDHVGARPRSARRAGSLGRREIRIAGHDVRNERNAPFALRAREHRASTAHHRARSLSPRPLRLTRIKIARHRARPRKLARERDRVRAFERRHDALAARELVERVERLARR